MSSSGVNIEERGVGGSEFNPWRNSFQEIVDEEVKDGVENSKKAKDSEAKDDSKNKSEDEKGSEIQQDKVKSDSPVEEESGLKVLTPGARKFFEPPAEDIIQVVNILTQNLTEKEDLDKCTKSENFNNIYLKDNSLEVDKSSSSLSKADNEHDIIEKVFRASRGGIIKLDKKIQNSTSRPKSRRTIILDGDQNSEQSVKKTQKSLINAADFCETIMDDSNFGEIEHAKQRKENELNVPSMNSYSFRRLPPNPGNSSKTNISSIQSHQLSLVIKSLRNRNNGVRNGLTEPQNYVLNLSMPKSDKNQEKSKEPVNLEQSHVSSSADDALHKPARRARKNSPVKKVSLRLISSGEEDLIKGMTKNFKNKPKVPDSEKPISNGKKTLNYKQSSGSNVSPKKKSLLASQSISPFSTPDSIADIYEFCEESTLNDQTPFPYKPKAKFNHEKNGNQEVHDAAETLLLMHETPNSLHNETKNSKNKKRSPRNDQAIMVNKENSFDILKESNEHSEKDDPSIYEEMRNLKKTLPTINGRKKPNSHTMEAAQSNDTPRVRTRAQTQIQNKSLEGKQRPSKKGWNTIAQDEVTASFSLPKAIDLNRTGFGIKSGKNNKKEPSFEKVLKGRKSRKPSLNSNMSLNSYEDILSSSIGNKPDDDPKESKQKEEAIQQITCITLKPDPVDINGVRNYVTRYSVNKPGIDKDVEVINKQKSQHTFEDSSTKSDELAVKKVQTSKDLKGEKNDLPLNHFGETKDKEIKEAMIVPTQKDTRVSRGRKGKKFVRNKKLKESKNDVVAVSSAFPATQPGLTNNRNKEDKNSTSFPSAQPTEGTRVHNSEVIEDRIVSKDTKHSAEDDNLEVKSSPVSDVDLIVSSTVEDQTPDSHLQKTTIFADSLEYETIAGDSQVDKQATGDNSIKFTSWVEEHKNPFTFTSQLENNTKDTCAMETTKNEIIEGVHSTGSCLEGRNATVTDKIDALPATADSNLKDDKPTQDTSYSQNREEPTSTSFPNAISTEDTSSQVNKCPYSTSFPPASPTDDIRTDSSLLSEAENSIVHLHLIGGIKTNSFHSKGDEISINFLTQPAENTRTDNDPVKEDPDCTDTNCHIEADCEQAKEVENLSDFSTAQLPEENKDPNSAFPTSTETEVERTVDSQIKDNPNSPADVNVVADSWEVKEADHCSAFPTFQPSKDTKTDFSKIEEIANSAFLTHVDIEGKKNVSCQDNENEASEVITPGSCQAKKTERSSDFPTARTYEDTRTDDTEIKENLNCVPYSTAKVNEYTTAAGSCEVKDVDHSVSTSQPCEDIRTDISKIEGSANSAFPTHVDTENKRNVSSQVKECPKTTGNEASEVITPGSCQAKEAEHSFGFPTAKTDEDIRIDKSQIKEIPISTEVSITTPESSDTRKAKIVLKKKDTCGRKCKKFVHTVELEEPKNEAAVESSFPTLMETKERTDKSKIKENPDSTESCETRKANIVPRKKNTRGRKCKKFVQTIQKDPKNEAAVESSFPTLMETLERTVDSKIKENPNSTADVNVTAADCEAKKAEHSSAFPTSQPCKDTKIDIRQIQEDHNSAFPTPVGTEDDKTDDRQIKDVDTEPERKVGIQAKEYPIATDKHSSAFRAVLPSEVTRTDSQVEEDPNFPSNEANEFITAGSFQEKEAQNCFDFLHAETAVTRVDSSQVKDINSTTNEVPTADSIELNEDSIETIVTAGIEVAETKATPDLVPNESIIIETIDDTQSILFQDKIDDQLIDGQQKISEASENSVAAANSQNKECIVGKSASEVISDAVVSEQDKNSDDVVNIEDSLDKTEERREKSDDIAFQNNPQSLKKQGTCGDVKECTTEATTTQTKKVDQTVKNKYENTLTSEKVVSIATSNNEEEVRDTDEKTTKKRCKPCEKDEIVILNRTHIEADCEQAKEVENLSDFPTAQLPEKNEDPNSAFPTPTETEVKRTVDSQIKENPNSPADINVTAADSWEVKEADHCSSFPTFQPSKDTKTDIIMIEESANSAFLTHVDIEDKKNVSSQVNENEASKVITPGSCQAKKTELSSDFPAAQTKKVNQTVKNKYVKSLTSEKVVSIATSNNGEETTKKRCKPYEEEEIVIPMRKKRKPKIQKKREEIPSEPEPEETSLCELLKKHKISNYIEIVNQLRALSAKNSASIVSKHDEKSVSDIGIVDEKKTGETSQTIRNVFINPESQEKSDDFKFHSIYKPQQPSKKQGTFEERLPAVKKKPLEREKRQERKNENKMEEKFLMSKIISLHEEFMTVKNNHALGHFPIHPFQFGQPSTSSNFFNPLNPYMQAPFSRSHRSNENLENNMPSFGSLPPQGFWPMDNRLSQPSFPRGVQTEKQDAFPHLTNDLPSFNRGFKRKQRSNPKEKKRRK